MSRVFLSLIFLIGASCVPAFADQMPTVSGDYCKDQAMNYLTKRFGGEFSLEVVETYSKGNIGGSYSFIIESEMCEGTIYLDTGAQKARCKTVHYGYVPSYLAFIHAVGDCKQFIPGYEWAGND